MHSHTIPRLLLTGFLFAFIAASVIPLSTAAKSDTEWSFTESRENVFVESCGNSRITTSFTITRTHRTVFDYRENVRFAGAIGNDTTGTSYAYDGYYTRAAVDDESSFAITDLQLRFEVGTPGMFTVSFAQVGFRLADSPLSVIKTIVPSVVQTDLCSLLGGPVVSTTSNNIDTNEPLQNLAPSYAPLPCDQPRMDPAYNC
jgi:hypothetical protein